MCNIYHLRFDLLVLNVDLRLVRDNLRLGLRDNLRLGLRDNLRFGLRDNLRDNLRIDLRIDFDLRLDLRLLLDPPFLCGKLPRSFDQDP